MYKIKFFGTKKQFLKITKVVNKTEVNTINQVPVTCIVAQAVGARGYVFQKNYMRKPSKNVLQKIINFVKN